MGVSSLISRRVRALGGALCEGFLEVEVVGTLSSSGFRASLESEGRVLSRSCWISLRERERPVPS